MSTRMKKTLTAIGTTATAVLAMSAGTAGTATAATQGGVGTAASGLTICVDSWFSNPSYNCKQNMTGRDTIYDVLKQIGPQWQDSISSIRNNTGKNLCFWEHNNYQGASFRLNNGYEWGDMGSWNDRVSSWKPC